MENTENNNVDSQQGIKILMQSYLSFLRNITNKNPEEVEKKLGEIIEIFSNLSEKDLFCNNEEISESEKYFINDFAPDLLRILLAENTKNANIRQLIYDLLKIYVKEFFKAIDSISLENTEFKYNLWEKVNNIFICEDNLFYRTTTDNKDAADSFLDMIYEKLNPNYQEWRNELKIGDFIDYLYKENTSSFSNYKGLGICNWTRAEILNIDDNRVAQIKLLGTDDIVNISLTSFFIMPFKMLSLDYEWREQIQKGDEIDFLDNRSWYRSTALEVSETISLKNLLSKKSEESIEPTKRQYLKYGLRVFRPEGRNSDSKGNRFFGWGETYDKEVSVHDPRIRKPNTFSKIIYNYDIINYYPLDSKRFTELETIIPYQVQENKFFIIPKKFDNKNISIYYFEILNQFCVEENGFDKIMKILKLINSIETQSNNTKNSSGLIIDQFFPVFSVLITFFNNINQFLHIQFASEYLKEVIEISISILKKFSLIETRNFKREKLENLIKQLKEMMYRVYIDSDVNAILDIFGVEFGINCLKNSIILDKKLLGFKVLNDTMNEVAKNCSNSSGFTDKHLPAITLVQIILEQNIFDLIFGPSSHSQILQKSGDFLKSLLITKNLIPKDYQKLLEICEEATDNETKSYIYKGLSANANQMSVEACYLIINYLVNKKSEFLKTGLNRFKITNDDIDLLINSFRALPLTAVKGIYDQVGDFLFDIIFYEEDDLDNLNSSNNNNSNSNMISCNASTSNSPNIPFLDNNSVNSDNLINNNVNVNACGFSILTGLKYEKLIEDFLVLMKSIEFRDNSNKVFEDILKVLKTGKQDNKEISSSKDFIGILKILRLLMSSYLNILDDSSKSRLLLKIYEDYAILDMLMDFIKQYHKDVCEVLNKEKLEKSNNINEYLKKQESKKTIGDRIFKVSRNRTHKHTDVFTEIINFINYMMTSQKMINLTKDQILTLYEIYVEDPINKSDVNIFFKMLKEADSKKTISQEIFQNVFEMMIESRKLEFSDISLDLFNCVWNFFLIINKNKKNLVLNEANSKPEGYQSVGPSGQQLYSFSYTNSQDKKNEEIKCVVDPNQLVGIDLIWRLVLSSSNNSQVSKEAINNLIKLYFNINLNTTDKTSDLNKEKSTEFIENGNKDANRINSNQKNFSWGLLIEKCIDTLKKITNTNLESKSPENVNHCHNDNSKAENKTKIINCLNILRVLIEESEKKGTAGCISHNSLLKSSIITLKIENSINLKGSSAAYARDSQNNNNNSQNEKNFSIKVYSNTTLWDLKKLIAAKIHTLPEGIRINTNNSKDITDNDHGKTLSELSLKDSDKLTVLMSQAFQNIPKQTLTKNGKFTEKAEKTFCEIFNIFANEDRLMDQESAARFATVATDSYEPLLVDDSRVKHLFELYDFDKDGFVTLEGFLKFFHDSIEVNRKIDTVWDNIKAFGYRNDLKKYFEPLDENNTDLHLMPRFLISKNQEYFNTIFSLQDEEEAIAKEASKFLSIICTNPIIYRDILMLREFKNKTEIEEKAMELSTSKISQETNIGDKGELVEKSNLDLNQNNLSNIWIKYIDVNNRFKLLYVLQIIESFFEEFEFATTDIDSEPFESAILDESVRDDLLPNHKIWWIENFLSNGGLELIIQKLYLNIDFDEIVSSHYLWKKILNLSTKIIKNSFSFLFRAFNLNKSDIVQFIRKESFGAIDEDLSIKNKTNFEEGKKDDSNAEKNKEESKVENDNNDLKKQLSRKLSKEIENFKQDEELIHLINKKYGDSIINRINFEQICLKLMIFSYIISLKKETEVEERNLLNNSINLLSLIIISQHNIKLFLNNLFVIREDIKEYISNNEKIFNQNIINSSNYNFLPSANILTFENFILIGLLRNTNIIIRMNFQKCLSNLCSNLQKINEFSLNAFLIDLFKNLLMKISSEEKTSSRYFFILFSNLIELNTHLSEEDEENLCFNLLLLTFENPAGLPEDLLIGYLKILILILKKRKDLIEKIMEKFDIVNKIIDTFILKDVEKLKSLFDNMTGESQLEFLETDDLKCFFEDKSNSSISSEARNSIFNLLLILLKDNAENTKNFFSGKFSKIQIFLSDLKKDKKMYNPSSDKRKKDAFIGIKNLNSICYMNSVLQQFFNVPSFRYALMQANDNEKPNHTDQNKDVDDNILHQLQRMFVYLEYSIRGEFNPTQFCYSFKDFDGQPTNVNIQNDAQEFLGRLFDKLENSLKKTEYKYLLNSIFTGKTCSQLICKGGCEKVRNNFEDFFSLSLEVQGKKTLKDSLEKYISEERIEDFLCENCQKKVTVTKRNSFAELPNVLIVHLQRIIFNYDTFNNEKINSRLEFPKKLNMKPYSTEIINNIEEESNLENSEAKENNNSNNNSPISEKNTNNKENNENANDFTDKVFHKNEDYYEYELVGVVVHLGVANAGHYFSYINIQREGTENKMNFNSSDETHIKKWMTFNDSSVLNFNLDQMEKECFGGSANGKDDSDDLIGWNKKNDWDNSKNAYMLVYEKINKNPITLVIPEKDLTEEVNKDENEKKTIDNNKLMTNDNQKSYKEILNSKKLNNQIIQVNKANYHKILKEISKLFCGISLDCDDTAISRRDLTRKNIYDFVFYNEDKEEYFYYIPFYKFSKTEKRVLPATHIREVLMDNLLFLNDQNIFCNEFSDFLDKVLANLYEFYSKDQSKLENESLYRNIFEILFGFALNILSKSSSRDALGKLINNLVKFLEVFPEFSKYTLETLLNNKDLIIEILFSTEESANLAYKNLIYSSILNFAKFFKEEIKSYQQLKYECDQNNSNNLNIENHSSQNAITNDKLDNLEVSNFLNSNKPLIYKFIDNLLDLMPTEISKMWNKMLAYLELFESLATSNNEVILDYLFEKELVSRLIDLALGKESPLFKKGESRNEIGNKVAPPKFTPLLNTVSGLVRRCYTETWTKEIHEDSNRTHIPNSFIELSENPEKIYSLSANDFECLYQRQFYKKCIKDNYNNTGLSKLLSHLMFDNFELSKKRVYMLMEAANEGISLQDAKTACELIFSVLNINDRFNIIRLEWIFGIPQMQLKLIDTVFPSIIKNKKESYSTEKIYKYNSTILYGTNLESFIERVIYKYQASIDYITILNYFFSIIYKNPYTFLYFDSMPHPKAENLRLKDHIFQIANEELNRIINITYSEKKFEKSILGIQNIMDIYEEKKRQFSEEFSKEIKDGKFKFQPSYSLGEITKEIIQHHEDDVINKHNIFCFKVEYENITKSAEEANVSLNLNANQNAKTGNEVEKFSDNLNNLKDKKDNEKISNNTKTEAQLKEEEKLSTNTQASSSNPENLKVGDLKSNLKDSDITIEDNSNNYNTFNLNEETKTNENNYADNLNYKNVINLPNKNDSSAETTYIQHLPIKIIEDFTKNNEELFYKKNIENLILSDRAFVRCNTNIEKGSFLTQNCIKRIVLYNNSDNEFKIRFTFFSEDDFENLYMPKSDVIVIAKKNSVVNVHTFVKYDCKLPWNKFNFSIDCELYENGKNNDNRTKDSSNNLRRSKSDQDVKGNNNEILALPSVDDKKNEVYGPQNDGAPTAEDSIPIDCMKCFHVNYFSSSTNVYICSGCKKDLFS